MTKSKTPAALSMSGCVYWGWGVGGGGLTLCQSPEAELSISPSVSVLYNGVSNLQILLPRAQEMLSSVGPERKALSLMLLTSSRAVKLHRLQLAD